MGNFPKKHKNSTFKFNRRLKFLLDVLDQIIMDENTSVINNVSALQYIDRYLTRWHKQMINRKATLLKYDVIVAKAQMNAKKGEDDNKR